MEAKKHLEELNLTISATWEDIKKAYRSRMKECHPDLQHENSNKDDAVREAQEVNNAYDRLKSFVTRTGTFKGIPEHVLRRRAFERRSSMFSGASASSKQESREAPFPKRDNLFPNSAFTTTPRDEQESQALIHWLENACVVSVGMLMLCFVVFLDVRYPIGVVQGCGIDKPYPIPSFLKPSKNQAAQVAKQQAAELPAPVQVSIVVPAVEEYQVVDLHAKSPAPKSMLRTAWENLFR